MFKSPFLYLFVCTLKNRLLGRLRRLREPKYAIGAVVGILYFYMVFFRRARVRSGGRGAPFGPASALPAAVLARVQIAVTFAATFALWLVVLVRWIVPVSRQPLQVSAPERDLLLPAPVAHRRIMRYKLLRSLLGIFFGSAVALFFAWTAVSHAASFLVGTFLLFTTIRLHLLAVALDRVNVFGRRRPRDPAGLVAFAVVLVAGISMAAALVPGLLHWQRTGDAARAFDVIRLAASQPAIAAGLLPFTVMIRPVFAAWPGPFLMAAAPVVAIALLNYWWVLRAENVFEASVETAEREVVAGRRAAPRPVRRRAPFMLALRGRAETAIVWKNLIMLGRYATLGVLLRIALFLVILALMAGTSRRSSVAVTLLPLAIALSCGMTVIGPYALRNDLRQDLLRLTVLKTWPISGERLLWGEILAPAISASALAWFLMLVTGGLSFAIPPSSLSWSARAAIGLAAALLFPALILAQVVVQNAAVVLFPGWVAVGPSRPRGVEAMGQQLLMFAGAMLVLVLGVLPGALLGGLVMLVGYAFIGWAALVPAALILTGLLAAEAVLAVHFLGGALERMDPAAVEAAG